jgi:hypothetical protein
MSDNDSDKNVQRDAHGRWLPGTPSPGRPFEPGNLHGYRKKKSKRMIDILRRRLEQPVREGDARTWAEVIIEQWIGLIVEQLRHGDSTALDALKLMCERLYGKSPSDSTLRLMGDGPGPAALRILLSEEGDGDTDTDTGGDTDTNSDSDSAVAD